MKNYLLLAFSLLLFSCGEKDGEKQADFSNITFQIDTVIVDPGNEIINLRYGLWNSVLNNSHSKLFLFDNQAYTLDIIDLDQLILERKVKFEKEGPNGVGSFVSWMGLCDDNRILLASFEGMGLFDLDANKLMTYKLEKDKFEGDSLLDGENFYRKSILAENGDVIYGLLGNWADEIESFAKIDFKNGLINKLELPGRSELPDYSVMLRTDNMVSIMASDKSVKKFENKLILSSSAYSTLFIIDIEKDSAYMVDYTPVLTSKAKKGGYPSEVDSEKRFKEVMEDIYAEINFQAPIWDPKNRRFYRFSYETIPTGNTDGPLFEDSEKKPIAKIYISIFDENFNLLGESLVSQIQGIPNTPFVKDGLIWSYVNVDDELGFLRMEIKY
ncbi:DUF4221 family protein [Cecembia rubra]|uniref:Uncharacterized protein DUF4221 n=1 Tax=Cecembia rubra TaxID=1485585 RepID=A0A2P8E4T1_9BACT|nr:DUF4221 family protein [Cecembia rubra]PSL04479.1 uncharacterized protein DUF4221 [Cecembia rubra]